LELNSQNVYLKNTIDKNCKTFSIWKLNVIKFVKTDGICESLLYGDVCLKLNHVSKKISNVEFIFLLSLILLNIHKATGSS
jgi:hypothetical protein